MIKVFQITDQEALYPACSFTYGMPVDTAFKPEEHIEKYEHVADLDVNAVQSKINRLSEAFEIGNIGPEEKITRHSDSIHSLSIGDILEVDGEKFIIGRLGFDKMEVA